MRGLEGDASGGVGQSNTKQAHLSLREAIEAAAAKLGQVPIESSRQATTPATHELCPENSAQNGPQLATIAKRFSAMALSGHSIRAHECPFWV
jgi:hypothetical protein